MLIKVVPDPLLDHLPVSKKIQFTPQTVDEHVFGQTGCKQVDPINQISLQVTHIMEAAPVSQGHGNINVRADRHLKAVFGESEIWYAQSDGLVLESRILKY
jgi:hypothetical protein